MRDSLQFPRRKRCFERRGAVAEASQLAPRDDTAAASNIVKQALASRLAAGRFSRRQMVHNSLPSTQLSALYAGVSSGF
jgi:hypothetical protein